MFLAVFPFALSSVVFAQTGSPKEVWGVYDVADAQEMPTADGFVEPSNDAQAVLNQLAIVGGGGGPIWPGSDSVYPPNGVSRFDVSTALAHAIGAGGVPQGGANANFQVTALDALLIINSLQNVKFHTNPNLPGDVNDSGHVSALDALLIINYLGRGEPTIPTLANVGLPDFFAVGYPNYLLYVRNDGTILPAKYYDTNGDGTVTSADAQFVINILQTQSN